MKFTLGEIARGSWLVSSPCARKIRHATWMEAHAHRESVIYRYGEEPHAPLTVYHCRSCGGWHIGRRVVVHPRKVAG
jgi:hypothetical protein